SFSPPRHASLSPLALHDALPICGAAFTGRGRSTPAGRRQALGVGGRGTPFPGRQSDAAAARRRAAVVPDRDGQAPVAGGGAAVGDRKSTRLNSSHVKISYAVFCL